MRLITLALASVAAGSSPILQYGGNVAGGLVAPSCPSGAPAAQSILMNTLFPGNNQGLTLGSVPALVTQAYACGYTGADSAGGIYHDWVGQQKFGIHPMVYGDSDVGWVVYEGGMPQNLTGGLDAHVAQLELAVSLTLPEDFAGYLGLDYEGWDPVWDNFLDGGIKNRSMVLVQEQNPTWNATKVAAEAEAQFNAAAQVYYQTTVRTIKSMRPKAQVGFYGTPSRLWHSYWNPEYRAAQQAHNDALQWLWDEVDIFATTLYIKTGGSSPKPPNPYMMDNKSYVRQLLGETQRLADVQNNASVRASYPQAAPHRIGAYPPPVKVKPTRPMVAAPFSWMRVSGTKSWLEGVDLEAEFKVPFEFPVVQANAAWGDPDVGGASMASLEEYFTNTFVPFAKTLMDEQCECQASKCSDHGRCVMNNTVCQCLGGWKGTDCSQADPDTTVAHHLSKPMQADDDDVICPDGVSTCSAGTTCGQLTTGMWSCCPAANATICGDFQHCCPAGNTCDVTNGVCNAA